MSASADYGSASGTLTFAPPQTVTEGDSVPVAAGFSGTYTSGAAESGQIAVSMDVTLADFSPGYSGGLGNPPNGATLSLGKPAPSVTNSVAWSQKWYLGPNYHDQTHLVLYARGQFISPLPGLVAQLYAYYTKVP